nr:RNA-directed DNA polymerase, eukaryota [Tanacetum cinerariifolium]
EEKRRRLYKIKQQQRRQRIAETTTVVVGRRTTAANSGNKILDTQKSSRLLSSIDKDKCRRDMKDNDVKYPSDFPDVIWLVCWNTLISKAAKASSIVTNPPIAPTVVSFPYLAFFSQDMVVFFLLVTLSNAIELYDGGEVVESNIERHLVSLPHSVFILEFGTVLNIHVVGYDAAFIVATVSLTPVEMDWQEVPSRNHRRSNADDVFIKVFNLDRLVENLCTIWIGRYHLYANSVRFKRSHKSFSAPTANATKVPKKSFVPQYSNARPGSYANVVNVIQDTSPDFVSDERIVWMDIEGIPLRAWSRETFKKIGKKWGETLDLEDNVDTSFGCKRLCVKTAHPVLISETFKIIVKGRVFMVRAKELFT